MKRTSTLRAATCALGLAVWMLGASAIAQPAPSPRRWIETQQAAIQTILRASPAGAPTDPRIPRIFSGMLDIDDLARRALDTHWTGRTDAERTEFSSLLRQLIEHQYQGNLDQTLNYAVTYEPETIAPDGLTATVRSVARSRTDPRAPPVTIEYRLHRRGNGWAVHDLVTNGSSTVQTYHDQYGRIITQHGFPELLNRMRTRSAAPPRAHT